MRTLSLVILGGLLSVMVTVIPVTAGTIYAVDIKVNNTSSYDALDFSVNYSAANGTFVGSGTGVQCTTNVSVRPTAGRA